MEREIKWTEKAYNSTYKVTFIVFDALKIKDSLKSRLVMTSFWILLIVCVYKNPTISHFNGGKMGQTNWLALYS